MYKHYPTLVLGFHACDREVGEAILAGTKGFKPSENDYDWLGHGMYFWENSLHRAQAYGNELKNNRKKLIDPMVIGAVIHLGYCFDLIESHSLSVLKKHYSIMENAFSASNITMPVNEKVSVDDTDMVFRKLDCAVIQYMHSEIKSNNDRAFDSVRGAFWEGKDLYPGAGFKEKNHIQICIRNPNCIKGYFRPQDLDDNYPRV